MAQSVAPGVAVPPEAARELRPVLSRIVPGLTQEEIHTLLSGGEVSGMYGENPSVRLAPAYAPEVSARLAELKPRIGVEVLFLVPSPLGDSGVNLELFRTLQAISTMAGIEYYSASRGHMRTLFYRSYIVDNDKDRHRLPDPEPTVLPHQDSLLVFQEDSSFGKNVLALTYQADADAVLVSMQNLTYMFYSGIVPAVAPRQLELHLIVRPVREYLLFYGNTGTVPLALSGMEKRVQTSFYNRLVALYDWYVRQLSGVAAGPTR